MIPASGRLRPSGSEKERGPTINERGWDISSSPGHISISVSWSTPLLRVSAAGAYPTIKPNPFLSSPN